MNLTFKKFKYNLHKNIYKFIKEKINLKKLFEKLTISKLIFFNNI